jgi:lipoyl(octanoyl) transferase
MKILCPPRTGFLAGLEMQNQCVDALQAGAGGDSLILLEHDPVYTIGRTRDRSSLRDALPHPVHEINRGGQATYHGPGQLTGYPVLDLSRRGRDLHRYLRFLERFLIRFSAEFGVEATRREGLTGVWVGNRKLASIGVGVRRWISMHGFAINIQSCSLSGFSHITPCGLDGVAMTSLETESGSLIDWESAREVAARLFIETERAEWLSAEKI